MANVERMSHSEEKSGFKQVVENALIVGDLAGIGIGLATGNAVIALAGFMGLATKLLIF